MKPPSRPKVFTPKHSKNSGRSFNGRKAIDALYDSTWEAYRAKFLAINPACYACGERAVVLDHIQRHDGDVGLFWKEDNYLPLCTKDHNTVTGLFEQKRFIGNRLTEKIKWLNGKRLAHGLTRKVSIVPFDRELLAKIAKLKAAAF